MHITLNIVFRTLGLDWYRDRAIKKIKNFLLRLSVSFQYVHSLKDNVLLIDNAQNEKHLIVFTKVWEASTLFFTYNGHERPSLPNAIVRCSVKAKSTINPNCIKSILSLDLHGIREFQVACCQMCMTFLQPRCSRQILQWSAVKDFTAESYICK
jgi:hypothetical protein